MSNMPEDFDPIAVVVDWLDACRKRDLAALLDFYGDEASLECACDGIFIHGRSALEAYWRPRLDAFVPTAFGLEEIAPTPDGVVLDYSSFEASRYGSSSNFRRAEKSGKQAAVRSIIHSETDLAQPLRCSRARTRAGFCQLQLFPEAVGNVWQRLRLCFR